MSKISFGFEHINRGLSGQVSASLIKQAQPDHFKLLRMIGAERYMGIRDSIDSLRIAQDGGIHLSLRVHAKNSLEGGLVGDPKLALFKEVKLNITRLELKGYLLDSDLANLAGLETLKVLTLRSTNLSNSAIEHLRGLRSLEVLDLGYNSIDDRAFMILSEIPSLKRLLLDGTAVSGKAVEKFMKARPDVYVDGFEPCAACRHDYNQERESLIEAAMAGLEEALRIEKQNGWGAGEVPAGSSIRAEAEKIVDSVCEEVKDPGQYEQEIEAEVKKSPLRINSLESYARHLTRYIDAMVERKTKNTIVIIRKFDTWLESPEGKEIIAKMQQLTEEQQKALLEENDWRR